MLHTINGKPDITIQELMEYKVTIAKEIDSKLSARDKYRVIVAMEYLNRTKDDFVEHLLFTYNYDGDSTLTFPMLSSYFRVYLYDKPAQSLGLFKHLNILLNAMSSVFEKGDRTLRPLIDFYNYVHNCM